MAIGRRAVLAALSAPAIGRAQGTGSLKLGLLHTLSPAPLYMAQGSGAFRDAGIDVQFRFFQAAQPIAAAAVAGDIDVGITALTGGFFSLAAKGALCVIGGGLHEERGYPGSAILVSRKAFDAGLTSPDRLSNHSFAITQYGSSFHYMIGRIADKLHFELKSVVLRPLQQIANMVAAVRSGQVDATIAIASMARPVEQAGEGRIIGWVGDIVPYQITALFTTNAMIADRSDALHRFARGYKRGVNDYRAGFLRTDEVGHPIHDALTDAAIRLIEPYVFTGDPQAPAKIMDGIGYYNEDGALDVADVKAQLQWFHAQDMVKEDIDPAAVINTAFIPPLPLQ